MRERFVVLAAAVAVGALGRASPALANADGIAVPDGQGGVDLTALFTEVQQSPGNNGQAEQIERCSLVEVAPGTVWGDVASTGGYAENVPGRDTYVPPGADGTWYYNQCRSGDTLVFIPRGSAPDPQLLALSARSHLALGMVPLRLAPSADDLQYVNHQTWFWVDPATWVPVAVQASAGPVTVTVSAVPKQLVIEMETGAFDSSGRMIKEKVVCPGPGIPFDPAKSEDQQSTTCGHVWHQTSAGGSDERLGVEAHVDYHVSWTVTGAAGGGDFGVMPSEPTAVRVLVGEIQTVSSQSYERGSSV